MHTKGKFIVLEGLDGSGKTTQMLKLKEKLCQLNIPCNIEKEPTDGLIGSVIRGAIKRDFSLQHEALALLFAADRIEHVINDIIPQLEKGINVLCDRFVFSNLAYQSSALSMEKIAGYNAFIMDKLMPDVTIFIDTSPELCAKRMSLSRDKIELFEEASKALEIRENFFKAFDMLKDKSCIKIIDGDKKEEMVLEEIWMGINGYFQLSI